MEEEKDDIPEEDEDTEYTRMEVPLQDLVHDGGPEENKKTSGKIFFFLVCFYDLDGFFFSVSIICVFFTHTFNLGIVTLSLVFYQGLYRGGDTVVFMHLVET